MQQRILLRRIHRQVIFARSGWVDELHDHVLAHAFNVAPPPCLKRVRRRGTATFLHWPVVGTARRMTFNLVWRSPHDVHVSAIGLPSWNTRGVMLIRIRNPSIMLFFEFVIREVWVSAAAQPELLDELFPLLVGSQLPERVALFRRNNVDHVLVQPLLIRRV